MRRLEQHLTVAADPRPKPPGEWLNKPGGETREYGETARPHGNRRLRDREWSRPGLLRTAHASRLHCGLPATRVAITPEARMPARRIGSCLDASMSAVCS